MLARPALADTRVDHLPGSSRPLWGRGDTLWVAEPDEFDVPWLVRYRIVE